MKQPNLNSERVDSLNPNSIKKGDRVWVKVSNSCGGISRLRMAEVLSAMTLPYSRMISCVTVHYLDDGDKMYECISLEQVEGLCVEKLP